MHEPPVLQVEAVAGPWPAEPAQLMALGVPDVLVIAVRPAEGAVPGGSGRDEARDAGATADGATADGATADGAAAERATAERATAEGFTADDEATAPAVSVGSAETALLAELGVDLPRRLARARAKGARGELTWIDLEHDRPQAVVGLGLGRGGAEDLRRSAAALVRRLRHVDDVVVLATAGLDADDVRAFTEGLHLATGTVTWSSSPPPPPPGRLRLVVDDLARGVRAVADGGSHAAATSAARRLIHTPSNHKDPSSIAAHALALGGADPDLEVEVWDETALARDGFGGLLAVGAGSLHPPRLVRLSRGPDDGDARHVVLVGKGITFDSGGLSLKAPEQQVGMKTDMSGAAAVLAVLAALGGRMPAGLRVTGLLALAENLPGADATRPGDVITHHGGRTSEVVNTDAEGRLVLADALDLAVRDLAADVVVDLATLTGAATLGLGRRFAPLYSTSDRLAAALAAAGEQAGELLWRMPLHDEYAPMIASEVADQANAAPSTGWAPGPGSITAALFLRHFVGDTAWAHLDIAGTGRSDAERDDLPKGGTGFGARLLLRWIEAGAPA
ncbi:MAG: leucyl aminopeptidase family protein [Candidatus Nanopelagicales bacterium]|nr:leucyl aminopeptidase family protein [Candidatus Nanopelagicales bacterium]